MFVYLILHHFIKQGDIQYIGAGNTCGTRTGREFILYMPFDTLKCMVLQNSLTKGQVPTSS